MKKALILFSFVFVYSCVSKNKTITSKPLYEIFTSKDDGGAAIRFFEILTEEKEIKMLQNDKSLKNKISAEAISTSNFVILNMGEKPTLGFTIGIKNIEETPSKIILTIQDNEPKTMQSEDAEIFYYPYTIVKINSKKEIVIQ